MSLTVAALCGEQSFAYEYPALPLTPSTRPAPTSSPDQQRPEILLREYNLLSLAKLAVQSNISNRMASMRSSQIIESPLPPVTTLRFGTLGSANISHYIAWLGDDLRLRYTQTLISIRAIIRPYHPGFVGDGLANLDPPYNWTRVQANTRVLDSKGVALVEISPLKYKKFTLRFGAGVAWHYLLRDVTGDQPLTFTREIAATSTLPKDFKLFRLTGESRTLGIGFEPHITVGLDLIASPSAPVDLILDLNTYLENGYKKYLMQVDKTGTVVSSKLISSTSPQLKFAASLALILHL